MLKPVFFFFFCQSAVPPREPSGLYCRWVPSCFALGWTGQQWPQGYLPNYNPLFLRPAVCKRLENLQIKFKPYFHYLAYKKSLCNVLS